MAAAAMGATDILITRLDSAPEPLARLAALSQQVALSVVIDHYAAALTLHQALWPVAAGPSPGSQIGLVIAVNCGADLRGIRAGHDTWTLARGVERLRGLKIAGLVVDDERPIYLDCILGTESTHVPPTASSHHADWTDDAVRSRRHLLVQTARRLPVSGPVVERRSVWCHWSELRQPAVLRGLADAGITEVRSMVSKEAEQPVASTLAVLGPGAAADGPNGADGPLVKHRLDCTVIGRPQLERAVLALGQVDLQELLGPDAVLARPPRMSVTVGREAEIVAIGREWSIVRLGPAARRWRIGDRVAVELSTWV